MTTPTESPLTRNAGRHARRIQLSIVLITIIWHLLTQFFLAATENHAHAAVETAVEQMTVLFIVVAIAVYTSWSAIWIVFGSGRWLIRVAYTVAIFHIQLVILLGMTILGGWLREEFISDIWWQESIAALAAGSYALMGSLFVSTMLIGWMKWLRYRLLYFDNPKRFPHPREVDRTVPIERCPDLVTLKNRSQLADLFVLTTLFAIYLGAWYPITEIMLQDDRMFGADFLFSIVLATLSATSAVGLIAVLLPMVFGMMDHRSARSQILFHTAILLLATGGATMAVLWQEFDSDSTTFAALCVTTLIAYQGLLLWLLHKPSKLFRFRFVRTKPTAVIFEHE